MSLVHRILLLLGLFGVPLALLVMGHRIRRAGVRRQRMFGGAVLGYCVAMALSLYASLVPPLGWRPDDALRGVLGLWTLVLLPAAGAALTFFTSRDP